MLCCYAMQDYSNPTLAKSLASDAQYKSAVKTWLEQRSFVPNAVAALGNGSALGAAISAEMQRIAPRPFDTSGFAPADPAAPIACGKTSVAFDGTGALIA